MSLRQQIKELAEKRNKLVKEARAVIEKADKEKRAQTSDETDQWERMMAEVDSMRDRIDQLERQLSAEGDEEDERDDEEEKDGDDERDDDEEEAERGKRVVKVINGKRYVLEPRTNRPNPGATAGKRGAFESEVEYRTRVRRSNPEYRDVFWDYIANGNAALLSNKAKRAVQADVDIVGGYLVAPQEFSTKLIKFVDNLLFIRQHATKFTLKAAQSLGAPSLDVDVSDSDWTSELNTGTEDTSVAFGKRELTPHPLAKRLKVSNKLLRMASISGGVSADGSAPTGGADSLVIDRLGYKFAVTEEKGFLTGNGVQQPLGVFTASSRGISTGRDFLSGSTTGLTADALISAKYNQKVQYWPRSRWLFHRNVLLLIRTLKNSMGEYLWVPGGLGGEGDRLLGFPVDMSEYAPSTLTTGQYIGLLADWSFYWIADSETLQIQRLVELYAAANQTGFIARQELDGMPVLEEAFTRLKTN